MLEKVFKKERTLKLFKKSRVPLLNTIIKLNLKNRKVSFESLLLIMTIFLVLCFFSSESYAQAGIESQIRHTIYSLVRLLNLIIVGFAAWAGFLIAKGDGSGQSRLIYAVIGLVVVNSSSLIINYFI